DRPRRVLGHDRRGNGGALSPPGPRARLAWFSWSPRFMRHHREGTIGPATPSRLMTNTPFSEPAPTAPDSSAPIEDAAKQPQPYIDETQGAPSGKCVPEVGDGQVARSSSTPDANP